MSSIDQLLAYVGDDFTGSTDALEALTLGGVPTVLLTQSPTEEMLRRWPNVRAVGLASTCRAMSPYEMDAHLPAMFDSLRRLQPKFAHYKTCSTFDSAPHVGSIGRAIDIGFRVFQNRFVPVVVGAPALGRHLVFGNLFARSGSASAPVRLDRHPSMSRHPITPMTEADLRVHLGLQTDRTISLVDVLALDAGPAAVMKQLADSPPNVGEIVFFDTLHENHLATIGEVLVEIQKQHRTTQFVVGSSGIEHALAKHWREEGLLASELSSKERGKDERKPVDRLVAVSGSCSPVTERQIEWAVNHGFVEVALDTEQLLRSGADETEIKALAAQAEAHLANHKSVIIHTARGPTDHRIAETRKIAAVVWPAVFGTAPQRLGAILGRILAKVLGDVRLKRIAVVGGDTSGHVAEALGITALEMIAPLASGSPLCVAHSSRPEAEGIEITFKGGQVGPDHFFGMLMGKD